MKMKRLAIVWCVFAMSSTAMSYFEDFESFTPAIIAGDGYTITNPGTYDDVLDAGFVDSTGMNAYISTGNGTNSSNVVEGWGNFWAELILPPADQFVEGQFKFDFTMESKYPPAGTPPTGFPALHLYLADNNNPAGIIANLQIIQRPSVGSDGFDLYDWQNSTVILTDFIPADGIGWHTLTINFDAAVLTYDVYVDGTLAASGVAFRGFQSKLTRVSIVNDAGYAMQFDDLTVQELVHEISGNVGAVVAGVVMAGFPVPSPESDINGDYAGMVPEGWSGTVTPVKPGYDFVPLSIDYTEVDHDFTNQDYTIVSYIISGNVGQEGVLMTGMPAETISAADGSYSGAVSAGFSGTITPELYGYSFSPTEIIYNNVQSNQSNQDYTPTALPGYTISGTVTSLGLGVEGAVMSGLRTEPMTDVNGDYSVFVLPGYNATVTPTLEDYSFSPTSTTYTNVQEDHLADDYVAEWSGELVLFETGFEASEGYVAGLPLQNQQGWNYTNGAPSDVVAMVSTNDHLGGEQSMEIGFEPNGVFQNFDQNWHEFPLKNIGYVTTEFSYRLTEVGTDETDTNHFIFHLGDSQSNGDEGDRLRERFDSPGAAGFIGSPARRSPDSLIHDFSASTGTWVNQPGISNDDEWKSLRVVSNLDADTFAVYGKTQSGSWEVMTLDDGSDAVGIDRAYTGGIGSINFYSIGPFLAAIPHYEGTESLFIDDIRVTWAPPGWQFCLDVANSPISAVDFTQDCYIDFGDFANASSEWMKCSSSLLSGCEQGQPEFFIPHGGAITVNGDLSDWTNPQWRNLEFVPNGFAIPDISLARYAVRWNDTTNKVYMAIEVDDSELNFAAYPEGERVEVFVQGDPNNTSGYGLLSGNPLDPNAVGSGFFDVAQHYLVSKNAGDSGEYATFGGNGDDPGSEIAFPASPGDPGLEFNVELNGSVITYELGITMYDVYGSISGDPNIVIDLEAGTPVRCDVLVFGVLDVLIEGVNAKTELHAKSDYNFSRARYTAQIQDYTLIGTPGCDMGYIREDVNHDCVVDESDLEQLAASWLDCNNPMDLDCP